MARRERTRHLIELGGLVQKAGLVELTDDDRATLYGAMLELATKVQVDANVLALWKRRGRRAFDTEAQHEEAGLAAGAPLCSASITMSGRASIRLSA